MKLNALCKMIYEMSNGEVEIDQVRDVIKKFRMIIQNLNSEEFDYIMSEIILKPVKVKK